MYSDANRTLTWTRGERLAAAIKYPSRDHNDGGSPGPDERMAQTPTNHSCPHQGMVAYWKSKYEEAQRDIAALRVRIVFPGQRRQLNNLERFSARH